MHRTHHGLDLATNTYSVSSAQDTFARVPIKTGSYSPAVATLTGVHRDAKKMLLTVLLSLCLAIGWFYIVGKGWLGSDGHSKDDVQSHYGLKNVVFRTWEEGQTPTRPIAAAPNYVLGKAPAALLGLLRLTDGVKNCV
jgi:hypothetical protein